MRSDPSDTSFIDLILKNIYWIIILLFFIVGKLTKVKKTSETSKSDSSQSDSEDERRVKEEMRRLINERHSQEQHHPATHHQQAHADESILTKTATHIPVKSYPHKESEAYARTHIHPDAAHTTVAHSVERKMHAWSFEDYSEQLSQQQKKIDQARALRMQAHKGEAASDVAMKSSVSSKATKNLAQIFANKSPLQQAILAKEILDQPLALRSSHLS